MTAKGIQCGLKWGVAISLKNPQKSWLWHHPAINKVYDKACASDEPPNWFSFDFCAFGTPWKKSTTLMCWSLPDARQHLERRCCGRRGICGHSDRPHVVLEGRHKNGLPMTQVSEPYPAPLCKAYALCAQDFLWASKQHEIIRLCGDSTRRV